MNYAFLNGTTVTNRNVDHATIADLCNGAVFVQTDFKSKLSKDRIVCKATITAN